MTQDGDSRWLLFLIIFFVVIILVCMKRYTRHSDKVDIENQEDVIINEPLDYNESDILATARI